jgi:hypothetical protein
MSVLSHSFLSIHHSLSKWVHVFTCCMYTYMITCNMELTIQDFFIKLWCLDHNITLWKFHLADWRVQLGCIHHKHNPGSHVLWIHLDSVSWRVSGRACWWSNCLWRGHLPLWDYHSHHTVSCTMESYCVHYKQGPGWSHPGRLIIITQ